MGKKAYALTGILLLIALAGTAGYLLRDRLQALFFRPTGSQVSNMSIDEGGITTVADSLQVPWGIAVMPDKSLLVTERSGTLRHVKNNSASVQVQGVAQIGEGGLLGIALHPKFRDNHYLYLYLTTKSGESLVNRVERYTFEDERLSGRRTIISDIPGAATHDGGELEFGPDGYLYVGTGDASNAVMAQDTSSLAGKILRLTADGGIPPDNPFANAVYSYGHRNVQGMAWDDRGNLWATEHGPSGVQSGFDELNKIEKGVNYGWPVIRGDEQQACMRQPVIHSGATETWAPADLEFARGSLYFAGLRSQALFKAELNENRDNVELSTALNGDYGRLRGLAIRDDSLLVGTSNKDGRGRPFANDDRIVEIPLNTLN